jgi:hypothetical protein
MQRYLTTAPDTVPARIVVPPQVPPTLRGREIKGHLAYTRRTARLEFGISKAEIQKFR